MHSPLGELATAVDPKDEEGHKFQELMNALHTRENSTLIVATLASSASVALIAAIHEIPDPALSWLGFAFPILGFSYRELTIFEIDRADYKDLLQYLSTTTFSRYDGWVGKYNHPRRLILRVLIILPSNFWLFKMGIDNVFGFMIATLSFVVSFCVILDLLESSAKRKLKG